MIEVKPHEFDGWLDAVLRQNRRPFWLSGDAPQNDVALSSRCRLMRNVTGYSFPGRADRRESEAVQALVRRSLYSLGFEERRQVSQAEAAMLVGSRLVSPDFPWSAPGRSIFLDAERSISLMVNEEDHIRLQAVTPGFSPGFALERAAKVETALTETMQFAQDKEFGYLAASPLNSGTGRRLGAMLHLIGMANAGNPPKLGEGFEVRGLLGESSTGIGSFVQVSTVTKEPTELEEAVVLLMGVERKARSEVSESTLKTRVADALEQIGAKGGLSLWKATNLVSWLRLGAVYGAFGRSQRELDALLALLSFGPPDEPQTNLRRKRLVARFLELTLPWAPS